MSVLVQTSYGDITIDLNIKKCPTASKNFIKLCQMKHYNNAIFTKVQKNHTACVEPKNPTTFMKEFMRDDNYRYFHDEIDLQLKLNDIGIVCTANLGPNLNDSSFFITLSKDNLSSMNGKHTAFGKVEQGLDVLKKINDCYVDQQQRPYMNVRILHTHILDDPFADTIVKPGESPAMERDPDRLEVYEHLEMAEKGKTEADIIKATREQKAKKQAVTLEMLGDLADADAKPQQNILFVCKLNPVTEERDLELIFSRFGPIKSCEIVRDWKTGQSLQYGFIEYENIASCEEAYLKMNNVLIDDRRIHVDFSQSVPKLYSRNKKQKMPMMSGQSKETRRQPQLIPKYREGREYYGQKSNKYDIVVKHKHRSPRRESRQRMRKSEDRKNKRDRSRSRDRKKRY